MFCLDISGLTIISFNSSDLNEPQQKLFQSITTNENSKRVTSKDVKSQQEASVLCFEIEKKEIRVYLNWQNPWSEFHSQNLHRKKKTGHVVCLLVLGS